MVKIKLLLFHFSEFNELVQSVLTQQFVSKNYRNDITNSDHIAQEVEESRKLSQYLAAFSGRLIISLVRFYNSIL